jgi:hypothetical protein
VPGDRHYGDDFRVYNVFRNPFLTERKNGLGNRNLCDGLGSRFCRVLVSLRQIVSRMKTVYYDKNGPPNQVGFRGGGSAWHVSPEPDRPWDEHFAELDVSEQLYQALFHLGIIDDFYELPNHGLLGAYEEGILRSSGLKKAAELLCRRAEGLVEDRYEWPCAKQFSPEEIEFKIIVDSGELKAELLALADFFVAAASSGYDVQLWL